MQIGFPEIFRHTRSNGHSIDPGFLRIVFLLIASLLFYSILHPPYLLLLLSTITVDWFLGKTINKTINSNHKRILLSISIAYNLGILIFFKYANFLALNALKIVSKLLFYSNKMIEINQFENLSNFFNISEVLLPLGISFFTFQSMSYTIDVYRGVITPEKSWIRYAFYISFFPQLVAGPIVKAREFLPQIRDKFDFAAVPLFSAVSWIALGAFKKAVLADRLAGISDSFYAIPDAYSSAFAWAAVLAYSFQIFLDFSGYTDIAIGLALLLGFRLPKNFDLPYLAYSFSDFWRRWHISLSSWLRDYLYVSLGGNRIGRFLTYRNLFLVMLLGGIWHGASWNFLIWGGLHGFFLAGERMVGIGNFLKDSGFWFRLPFRILVFLLVTILWIFFRSPEWDISIAVIQKLFSQTPGMNLGYTLQREFLLVCTTLGIGHFLAKMGFHPSNWTEKEYRPVVHSLVFALIFIAITLLAVPGKPFIYFVF